MHDCDECGAVCYCDMDDCWFPTPSYCRHVCDESGDSEYEDEPADDPAPRPSTDKGEHR
jgi:hypothetical protein